MKSFYNVGNFYDALSSFNICNFYLNQTTEKVFIDDAFVIMCIDRKIIFLEELTITGLFN